MVGNLCIPGAATAGQDETDPVPDTGTDGSSGGDVVTDSWGTWGSSATSDGWNDTTAGQSTWGCTPFECGVDVSCGVVDDGCGGQLDCGACDEFAVQGIIPVRMVGDRTRGRLYVTVRSDSPTHANELVTLDPSTATVVSSVFIGSDPSSLALSDDHSTLWVALDGSYEIRRVDLTTPDPTPGANYALPPGDWGEPAVAGPMVVLAGTTGTVAVSLHQWGLSPSFQGVAVLDDGVPRPVQTPGHTGASRLTGGPADWIFGFNDEHTGFGFYALHVLQDGPTQTEHEGLVSGFNTDIIHADGRVYATNGAVIDVSNPAAPVKAGMFPFVGEILPRPDQGRILMLSPANFDQATALLRDLDPQTFTQKGQHPLSLTGEYMTDFTASDDATLAVIAWDWDHEPAVYIFPNPFAG